MNGVLLKQLHAVDSSTDSNHYLPRIVPSGLHRHLLTDIAASFIRAACTYRQTVHENAPLQGTKLLLPAAQNMVITVTEVVTCKGNVQELISQTLKVL